MRLMDVRPGVRDVFAAQLDGNVEGVPNWEQFGEKLLNMDTVTLRQFKSSASPTKAILNKEIGDDPSATLEDAFEALKAIGRNDVVSLVLEKLDSRNSSMSREGSEDRTSPPNHPSTLLVDQRLHRTEPCTDRDTGVTAQQNVCFDPALEQRMQTITAQSTLPPKQSSLEKKVHRHDSFDQTTGIAMYYPCLVGLRYEYIIIGKLKTDRVVMIHANPHIELYTCVTLWFSMFGRKSPRG